MDTTVMDYYRALIYDAAKEGKIAYLRSFFDTHSKIFEVESLVNVKSNGATPLIMASRNGHLEVVKFLIKECNAQVEQVGSVTFDGETIEGAPPLWCAAAAGHLKIVEHLVENGADVNKTTFTNSTPLRAACFDGHLDIVKYLISKNADIEIANRHGHTCLMISSYKNHFHIVELLLKMKANVNRWSAKGNTALHDCAEAGSLDILKLLLKHGAVMMKDHYNITPLMAAAVAGYLPIVEYLNNRSETTKLEKIEALELLGATYIDRKRDNMAAYEFWQKALKYRYEDKMKAYPKPSDIKPVKAYDYCVEANSIEELSDLLSDPDEMRMQALLVRERILGPVHPDTSYYIRYRGALYADTGNFDQCISLWMYALDMQQSALEPLSPMTQSSFLSFAELFSFMITEWRKKDLSAHLKFDNHMAVLERAVRELKRGLDSFSSQKDCKVGELRVVTNLNRLMVIILHLISLMSRLEPALIGGNTTLFRQTVYDLVRLKPHGTSCNSLLHLACSEATTEVGRYPICKFPNIDVVRLLIHVGADVNALNVDGDSPLHIAAKNASSDRHVLKVLLENGSHLDACNSRWQTPEDLLSEVPLHTIVSPLCYTNLKCLASRVIVTHGIPYKGNVDSELEKTVEIHSGFHKTVSCGHGSTASPDNPSSSDKGVES